MSDKDMNRREQDQAVTDEHEALTTTKEHSDEVTGNMISCDDDEQRNTAKGGSKASWRSRLRNRDFRRKLTRTVWLCFCAFCSGVIIGQRGPAFLDLQLITNTNVQRASAFLTAAAAGSIAGSLLSGPAYDLLSQSLLLIVSMLLTGVLTVVIPFCSPYWLMVTVSLLHSVFLGAINTTVNADMLKTWERRGEAALQALHFSYALGGVLAPLITQPFLARTPRTVNRNHSEQRSHPLFLTNSPEHKLCLNLSNCSADPHHQNSSFFNVSLLGPVHELTTRVSSVAETGQNVSQGITAVQDNDTMFEPSDNQLRETQVHFAFLISAILVFLSSIPLLVEYFKDRKYKHIVNKRSLKTGRAMQKGDNEDNEKGKNSRSNLPLRLYLAIVLWNCLFYVLYCGVEGSFPAYLTTYVVLQLQWSKSAGAVLTSVYWISLATSRFACIFLVKALNPLRLLLICLLLLVASLLFFLLASLWQLRWGVWVSSAVGGAALSSVVPAALSWLDKKLMPVTGRVVSAVILSAHLGQLLDSQILGDLMENHGAIWLAYILLGEATVSLLTFLLLLLFVRLCLPRRYHLSGSGRRDVKDHVTAKTGSFADDVQSENFLNSKTEVSTTPV